ncbi:hypothetical protein VNO78_29101 [Psophocarpus tetragonolobus]|uniref:Uncharacterized protein n=1 Tax=Psophocarpus tetragonolobus TaxID=3891 RepID=A0AAN9RUI1_PSOTE
METALNDAVSSSFVWRYFKLQARRSCFTRELPAAIATFLTMAYIITTVNATILTASDCSTPAGPDCTVKPNVGYESCRERTKSDLVVATAVSALVGFVAMGLLANLTLGLAPGILLAVILVEGCVFLFISAVGLPGKLAKLIPQSVRLGSAAGIGLFIAFTGLQAGLGVGLIGPDPSNLVTITACKIVDPETGTCLGGKMQSPKFWLGLVGFLITSYGHSEVTYFPDTPLGNANYNYVKQVVGFHKIESTAGILSQIRKCQENIVGIPDTNEGMDGSQDMVKLSSKEGEGTRL